MAMPPPSDPSRPQPAGTPDRAAGPKRPAEVPPEWLPKLELVEGDAGPQSVTLGAKAIRVGRAAGNDIVLVDDRASRNHAQVVREGWNFVLEDLHSTNGVSVNGTQIERAVLEPGCRIKIGSTVLVFTQPVPEVPRDARRSLFASNELLQSLAVETRGEIADRLAARVVPAGAVVVRAGQPLSGMLLVYLGRLRLVSVNDEGAERVVGRVGPGDSFGESVLVGGRNADHTLVAEEDSCVFELLKSELTGLLARRPAEGRRVVETVLGMMIPSAHAKPAAASPRSGAAAPAPAPVAIVGNDPKIVRAKKAVETLAKDDRPILIVGPAGSGKKTFARHFHRSGAHASEAYNELSIAGLEPARILPAIIGTDGGAAAGGAAGDVGLLELMGEGTLAICHAERLDAHQQCVLADYAQCGWFHREHGRLAVQSRVRIVFVTTGTEQEVLAGLAPPLRALVEGRVVALPSLAQRVKDVPPLAEHLLQLHAAKAAKRSLTLSREAIDRLIPYPWPGNVSELEFVMQRAAILAPEGTAVTADLIFVVPPEEEALKINLLRDEKIRATLRNPWLVPALTWICMGFIGLVVVTTLYGALAPAGHPFKVTATNPAMMVTWFVWFPILPLVTASVGRVWCAVCPIAGFGDLFGKLGRFNLPAPRLLKRLDIWTLVAAFIIIEFGEGLFGVDSSPGMTLAFLAGLLFVAAATTVLYERRAFCRYLCPLAGWLGAYSALSPLEIRGNKKVCQTQCGEHTCYKGTDAVPGCPMFLYPAAMNSNAECLLCTNCVKSCANRGVQLNLRPPLVELWRNPAPSVGLAVLAFVLLGVMSSHWITKLPFWKAVKANPPLPLTVVELTLFFGCIIAGVISLWAASLLSAAASREKLASNMARYGAAFIPLAFASHASLMLKGLLSTDFPTMWAWARGLIFSSAPTAAASAAIAVPGDLLDPAVVSFIQGLTIIGGIVGSLIAIVFVARRAEKSAVMARALPHLLLAVVLGVGLMYCLLGRAVKPTPGAADLGTPTPASVSQPADASVRGATPISK
jgi:transcriptional regulator with AAA-type ATPase domain/pSer/pThr/pTyr-binding forkhead associated (FHA) protein